MIVDNQGVSSGDSLWHIASSPVKLKKNSWGSDASVDRNEEVAMLNESNKLSSGNANSVSYPPPETLPTAPTHLDVPAGDRKLHLRRSAPLETVTDHEVYHSPVDAAAIAGIWPDTRQASFKARDPNLRRVFTRLMLLLSACLRVFKVAAENIRAFPADYRASRQWLGGLDQQVREHYEHKVAPCSDMATQEPAVFDPDGQLAECDVVDLTTRLSFADDERDEAKF